MLKRLSICCVLVLAALVVLPAASASAAKSSVEHLHFRYGPLHIKPGSNLILGGYATPAEKPSEPGYIIRMAPNLKTANGAVPPT